MIKQFLKKDYKLLFLSIVIIYIIAGYAIYRANYIAMPITFFDNLNISDISPLPQLLATCLFGVLGIILTHLFSNSSKFNIWHVLIFIPMGIFPYFIPVLTARLSIFFIVGAILLLIIPFLFRNNLKKFVIISFICIFISIVICKYFLDIYLIMIIFLSLKDILNNKFNKKFIIYSTICFIIVVLLYKLVFHEPIIYFKYFDIIKYFRTIYYDLKLRFIIPIILTIMFFIITTIRHSNINKLASFFIIIGILLLTIIIIYFKFLLTGSYDTDVSNLYSFGFIITILWLFILNGNNNIILKLTIIMLSWVSINFVTVFGNILGVDAKYNHFYMSSLINDINELNKDKKYSRIAISSSVGFSLSTRLYIINDQNWIIERLIKPISDQNLWLFKKYMNEMDDGNYEIVTFYNYPFETYKESLYYIIGYDDNTIFILLNEPCMHRIDTEKDINYFRVC